MAASWLALVAARFKQGGRADLPATCAQMRLLYDRDSQLREIRTRLFKARVISLADFGSFTFPSLKASVEQWKQSASCKTVAQLHAFRRLQPYGKHRSSIPWAQLEHEMSALPTKLK